MKNKKKKKLKIKRIIVIILVIVLFRYMKHNYLLNKNINENFNISNSNYEIIKQDKNENYSGIGQEKVKNKDGYLSTFTTIKDHKKTYKEYKQNGNSPWCNKNYWGGTMADNGCGITAISIILSGYNKNFTPENLRKKYYPVLNNDSISKELSSTFGIKNSDFYYDTPHLSNSSIEEHLKTNRPILICVWNKPTENRWTKLSHYMALLATDENNMVYVSNPNGLENDSKSSGWYDINEITPYIAKALYIYNY